MLVEEYVLAFWGLLGKLWSDEPVKVIHGRSYGVPILSLAHEWLLKCQCLQSVLSSHALCVHLILSIKSGLRLHANILLTCWNALEPAELICGKPGGSTSGVSQDALILAFVVVNHILLKCELHCLLFFLTRIGATYLVVRSSVLA